MCGEESVDSYLKFVLPLVKEAGRVSKQYVFMQQIIKIAPKVVSEAKHIVAEVKSDIYDLVTEYDRKVEDILIETIKQKYPNHK